MNQAQQSYLTQYGLNEVTLAAADPTIRLQYANMSDVEDAPAPVIELNALQKEYLGGRALSEVSASDRDNLDWLGTFTPKIEEPAEVAKPVEDSAPVVVDAHSVIDPKLIESLSPVRRAGLADALDTVRRGLRVGDSISRIAALEQAKFYLAPYMKRKR